MSSRIFPITPARMITDQGADSLLNKEWLLTNGLGGYASGTLGGVNTRRHHGILIAAHPAPLGRVMMLNHLTENFRFPDWSSVAVGGNDREPGRNEVEGSDALSQFTLEYGLPIWRYETQGHVIEKRIFMPHYRNTTHIQYRLISGDGPIRLKLFPSVHFRSHNGLMTDLPKEPYMLTAVENRYEIVDAANQFPKLRLYLEGDLAAFTLDSRREPDVYYRVEHNRGYEGVGTVWQPGQFRATLTPERDIVLTVSTERWDSILSFPPDKAFRSELDRRAKLLSLAGPAAKSVFGSELVLAADQFIIRPNAREEDSARAHAEGDEARTIIAGYPWFTDWGRDTMISLEGLTLCTGRTAEAGYILRNFASHVRDGLIPNFFPDQDTEGLYHTADATLWFFHALDRYLQVTKDQETLISLLPTMKDIVAHHQRGTRFGIGVDPTDGLLKQGAEGYQLTWMDAKVEDWVVTPRRGKAVEINALWYNALRLLEEWLRERGDVEEAEQISLSAQQAFASFNKRFWVPGSKSLLDIVDGEKGDDDSCRPNQVFAISLKYPVLDKVQWPIVMTTVRERLLTPLGLRTLAPGHPDYKEKYYGDLRSRDAAYHQGTVWAWLIGPFLDAWAKTYPDQNEEAKSFLSGFSSHLSEACIGSISEVFDAEPPYTPGGCIAQAWSVSEVLRSWLKVK